MELKDIYNDKEKLEEYIVDLKTLNEVLDFRRKVAKTGEKLNILYLFDNYLCLDSYGYTLALVENNNEFKRYNVSPYLVPYEEDRCECCGKKWTLDTIKDFYSFYDEDKKRWFTYHKSCYEKYKVEWH